MNNSPVTISAEHQSNLNAVMALLTSLYPNTTMTIAPSQANNFTTTICVSKQ